jgi:hypothetical protein
MVMADLARAIRLPVQMDWMAISSYGSGTKSSGVVRILKDLDTDICGRHVLVVEDIIDSGLTLSWLMGNLRSREPASLAVCVLLRKPGADQMGVEVDSRATRLRWGAGRSSRGGTRAVIGSVVAWRGLEGTRASCAQGIPGAVYRQVSPHHSRG